VQSPSTGHKQQRAQSVLAQTMLLIVDCSHAPDIPFLYPLLVFATVTAHQTSTASRSLLLHQTLIRLSFSRCLSLRASRHYGMVPSTMTRTEVVVCLTPHSMPQPHVCSYSACARRCCRIVCFQAHRFSPSHLQLTGRLLAQSTIDLRFQSED
jgi:hypothetical protein